MRRITIKTKIDERHPILKVETNGVWKQCDGTSQCSKTSDGRDYNCRIYATKTGKIEPATSKTIAMESFPVEEKRTYTLGEMLQELISYSHIH